MVNSPCKDGLVQPLLRLDDKLTLHSQGSCRNPGLEFRTTFLWFISAKGESIMRLTEMVSCSG